MNKLHSFFKKKPSKIILPRSCQNKTKSKWHHPVVCLQKCRNNKKTSESYCSKKTRVWCPTPHAVCQYAIHTQYVNMPSRRPPVCQVVSVMAYWHTTWKTQAETCKAPSPPLTSLVSCFSSSHLHCCHLFRQWQQLPSTSFVFHIHWPQLARSHYLFKCR